MVVRSTIGKAVRKTTDSTLNRGGSGASGPEIEEGDRLLKDNATEFILLDNGDKLLLEA